MKMRDDECCFYDFVVWQMLQTGGFEMTGGKKEYVAVTCGHCDGIGCTYCNKTGIVLVVAPQRKCNECEGVGCIYCGFTGWAEPKGKYD
jgi:hypothetical protein